MDQLTRKKYRITHETIEPVEPGFYAVYLHGTYPSGSVLSGTPYRGYEEGGNDLLELRLAHPKATVLDHSTRVHGNPLPKNAPSWFDPGDAGEVWDEDDY